MKHESIDGLVVRATKTGENDVFLSVLSAKRGRFGLLAKGARSIKGGNLAISQPFTLANFEYYSRGGINILKGGHQEKSFFSVSQSSTRAYLAFYLCDLACELSDEEVEAEELLRLSLNMLYALSEGLYDERRIKAAFELRSMALSGYTPRLSGCSECGAHGEALFLNVTNGTLVCRNCLSKKRFSHGEEDRIAGASALISINASVLAAMHYCLASPLSRIFSFSLEEEADWATLSKIAESYVLNHLERGFETLNFYHNMEEDPDLSSYGIKLKT